MYLISDTLYSKEFSAVIKRYLNISLKKDWIGRLYGIMNPNLNMEGMFDFNKVIIEIDGDNTNNNEFVKSFVYRQMNLIADLFKINKLYDYINLSITHVGPDNQDNYLVVFDVVSRKEFVYCFKRFIKHLLFYACIAGIVIAKIYIY